ncbi:MAG: hypothetical protein Q4F05_01415 [bacterium]|nr:hypothetical protein [bacterium]
MSEREVVAIGFAVMGLLYCLGAVMTIYKPKWTLGRSAWYRVREDMETAYKKKCMYSNLFYAAVYFICGILSYIGVHMVILFLLMVLAGLIGPKLFPEKESYFYGSSSRLK